MPKLLRSQVRRNLECPLHSADITGSLREEWFEAMISIEDMLDSVKHSVLPEEVKTLNSNYSFKMSGLNHGKTLEKSRVEEECSVFVLKPGHD